MPNSLRPHALYSPWNSPGQNTGVDSLSLLQGDLPNPRIKPRSPALEVDSLPAEPPGKPKNIRLGSLSLLQGIFPTQESNRGLLRCRQILYQLSYQARLRQIVLTRGSQMAAHSIITWGTFKYSDAEIIIKTGETQKYIFKVPWM